MDVEVLGLMIRIRSGVGGGGDGEDVEAAMMDSMIAKNKDGFEQYYLSRYVLISLVRPESLDPVKFSTWPDPQIDNQASRSSGSVRLLAQKGNLRASYDHSPSMSILSKVCMGMSRAPPNSTTRGVRPCW